MERRAKVELFEEIRREYEFGIGSVHGVARKLGVHRRQVRQALADAQPRHETGCHPEELVQAVIELAEYEHRGELYARERHLRKLLYTS